MQQGDTYTILMYVALAAAFYFLFIRPQMTRTKQVREMLSKLAVGDRVMTTSGILATVRNLDDDGAELEIAPGVVVRFVKRAIAERLDDERSAGAE